MLIERGGLYWKNSQKAIPGGGLNQDGSRGGKTGVGQGRGNGFEINSGRKIERACRQIECR